MRHLCSVVVAVLGLAAAQPAGAQFLGEKVDTQPKQSVRLVETASGPVQIHFSWFGTEPDTTARTICSIAVAFAGFRPTEMIILDKRVHPDALPALVDDLEVWCDGGLLLLYRLP